MIHYHYLERVKMKRCTTVLVTFITVFLGFSWEWLYIKPVQDFMDATAAVVVEDKWKLKPFSFVSRELILGVENVRIVKLTNN